MTLAMCCHVEFPENDRRPAMELRQVAGVEVRSTVHNVCQEATVKLPRNIEQFRRTPVKELLRRGDAVVIRLGYGGDLREEFRGFLTSVGADVPIVLECRDGLWKLLQQSFSASYKAAHVPTMVKELVGGAFQVVAMDATVGPVRFAKVRKSEAFKALTDSFGLVSYLKGDTVYCGVLFDTNAEAAVYDLEKNVRSSDLKYRLADEVSLKVTAKSLKRDGSDITVEVGDPDGEARTLNYYGINSKAELEKLAKADLEKFKYDGFEGGFKGFGIPWCRFGDKVDLRSSERPERNGLYLAEAVNVTFGPEGFVREVKLAQQWAATSGTANG
ncbi:MAG: hypothetical protein JST38_08420 [Bacteroidetes bacterium]|nr:hypothetical protein [Bacteroidota bacterium]